MSAVDILAHRSTVGAELVEIDFARIAAYRSFGPPDPSDLREWRAALAPRGSAFGVSGAVPFRLPGDNTPGARSSRPHLTILIPARTREGAEVSLTIIFVRDEAAGWAPVSVFAQTGLAADHHRKYFPRI